MNGEFTGLCCRYYQLKQLLEEDETRFRHLLRDSIPYYHQTRLSELDAIIACNREIQKAKADIDQTAASISETGLMIQGMMQYFGIPAGTKLTGVMPEKLEFEVWADEAGDICISKTKDLAPQPNENIITITFSPVRPDPFPKRR